MSHPLDSLEKIIVENSDDFIIDSNIIADSTFSKKIYDCYNISNMDMDNLIENKEYFQKIDGIFSNLENVYIIKEITEENRRLLQICNEKCEWFKKKPDSCKEKIESFKQFNDYLFNLILTTKQRTLKPNDKLYNKILQCTGIIVLEYNNFREHKDNNKYGIRGEKRDDFSYLGTDEKLIATVLHRALTEKKDASIITKDKHLCGKFGLTYRLITCKELDNRIGDLKNHNLKVVGLSRDEKEYEIIRQTKNFSDIEKFSIDGVTGEYRKSLKEKINNILKV